jgi:hypothetical protein
MNHLHRQGKVPLHKGAAVWLSGLACLSFVRRVRHSNLDPASRKEQITFFIFESYLILSTSKHLVLGLSWLILYLQLNDHSLSSTVEEWNPRKVERNLIQFESMYTSKQINSLNYCNTLKNNKDLQVRNKTFLCTRNKDVHLF